MDGATFRRAMETVEHIADPTPPWKDVLQGARDVVGADACTLVMFDRTTNLLLMEQIGMDAATERDYKEHFYKEDILASAAVNSPVGIWWDTVELTEPAAMRNHPFYADFMRRHRMGQISTFVILAEPERRAAISFERITASAKPSIAWEETLRSQFTQALIKAVAQREASARAQFDTIEAAFKQVDEAYLLVNATGAVFRCSTRAFEILNREKMLGASEMRLVHENGRVMAGLKQALCRAAHIPTGVSYAVPVSWGRALKFDIVPAAAAFRMSNEDMTLVRIREMSAFRTPAEEELSAFFSLSSAEARVLRNLVAGHSPAEIAAAIGVAERTVRNQIASLMRKMSCSRQAELVRLGTLLL